MWVPSQAPHLCPQPTFTAGLWGGPSPGSQMGAWTASESLPGSRGRGTGLALSHPRPENSSVPPGPRIKGSPCHELQASFSSPASPTQRTASAVLQFPLPSSLGFKSLKTSNCMGKSCIQNHLANVIKYIHTYIDTLRIHQKVNRFSRNLHFLFLINF